LYSPDRARALEEAGFIGADVRVNPRVMLSITTSAPHRSTRWDPVTCA